nr:hypothetical protein [uncultured Albidiferax sp.]
MQVAKLAVPTVLMACALSGCVVAPYGPRAYGPRVYVEPAVVTAPAPVVVVPRPYDRPDWRYGRGGPHWRDRDGRDHRR